MEKETTFDDTRVPQELAELLILPFDPPRARGAAEVEEFVSMMVEQLYEDLEAEDSSGA